MGFIGAFGPNIDGGAQLSGGTIAPGGGTGGPGGGTAGHPCISLDGI